MKKLHSTGALGLLILTIIIGTPSVYAYQKIKLNLEGNVTDDLARYRTFIRSVQGEIPYQALVHTIPLLYAPHQLHESKHFIEVELKSPKRRVIDLAIYVIDLSIIGFRLPNFGAYYFSDTQDYAKKYVFKGSSNFFTKKMTKNDEDILERHANRTRDDLSYKLQALYDAIDALHENVNNKQQQAISMQLFNLFISEALRFTEVANYMELVVEEGHYGSQLDRYNQWYNISNLVQSAPENGIFPWELTIENGYSETHYYVYEQWEFFAFLLFTCQPRRVERGSFPLFARTSKKKDKLFPRCPAPLEQEHLICGIDHTCLTVKAHDRTNGNPVIVSYRDDAVDPPDIWEVKMDGTIRLEKQCMTVAAKSKESLGPGSFVVIHDCDNREYPFKYWQVKHDTGEIVHLASGLYLTQRNWYDGEIEEMAKKKKFKFWTDPKIVDDTLGLHLLSLEPRNFTLGQGWMLRDADDKQVWARSSTIMTDGNLCIQKDDNNHNLILGACDIHFWKQRWILFADGSIRVKDDTQYCISHDDTFQDLAVTLSICDVDVRGQRWELRPDGSIRSFGTDHGIVVQQDEADQQLFISLKGEPLTIWVLPMLKQPKTSFLTKIGLKDSDDYIWA